MKNRLLAMCGNERLQIVYKFKLLDDYWCIYRLQNFSTKTNTFINTYRYVVSIGEDRQYLELEYNPSHKTFKDAESEIVKLIVNNIERDIIKLNNTIASLKKAKSRLGRIKR